MPRRYFLILLILPSLALAKLLSPDHWQLTLMYFFAAISLLTLLVYWYDKRSARRNTWRTPESTLHALALLGGWPAAFLGTRLATPKTAKRSFQRMYWCTVGLHHYLALDILLNWQIAHSMVGLFRW